MANTIFKSIVIKGVIVSCILIGLGLSACSPGGGSGNSIGGKTNDDIDSKNQDSNSVLGQWMTVINNEQSITLIIQERSMLVLMQCPAKEQLILDIPIQIQNNQIQVLQSVNKKTSDRCLFALEKGSIPFELKADQLTIENLTFQRIKKNKNNGPQKPNPENPSPQPNPPVDEPVLPPNQNPADNFSVGFYSGINCQGTFTAVNINGTCSDYRNIQVKSVEGSDGCFNLNRNYDGEEVCQIIRKNSNN